MLTWPGVAIQSGCQSGSALCSGIGNAPGARGSMTFQLEGHGGLRA